MTTIEPRVFPTYRTIRCEEDVTEEYERLTYLIKKYGCPVTKVSDSFDWIRVYFEIPIGSKEEFLKELSE